MGKRTVLEAIGSRAAKFRVVSAPSGKVWNVVDGLGVRAVFDDRMQGIVHDVANGIVYRTLQIASANMQPQK